MGRVKPQLAAALLVGLLAADQTVAQTPEWDIHEVFSSSDGSVQFIELIAAENDQQALNGTTLSSFDTGNEFTFDHDLASASTAGRSLLLGTTAFAALPGAPTPDFIIPAQFFSFADGTSDALVYGGSLMPINGPGFALPLDGLHSLEEDGSSPVNSPTNFAGDTGTIRVWSSTPWHNDDLPLDVNASGTITPLDALTIINELNANGSHDLPSPPTAESFPPPFYDTDGDNIIKPLDALLVINFLNEEPSMSSAIANALDWAVSPGSQMQPAIEGEPPQAVPEPSSMLLAGIAGCLIALKIRRSDVRR